MTSPVRVGAGIPAAPAVMSTSSAPVGRVPDNPPLMRDFLPQSLSEDTECLVNSLGEPASESLHDGVKEGGLVPDIIPCPFGALVCHCRL